MALIYRVRVASSGWLGGPGLNTFYFVPTADPEVVDSATAGTIADNVRAAFEGAKTAYPSTWKATVNPVVDILTAASGELSTSFSVSPPADVIGTGGANFGPVVNMLVLSLLTDTVINGHRVRGRAFLGPMRDATSPDGSPTPAQLALVQQLGTDLRSVDFGTAALAVWHRPVAGVGGAVAPVTSHFVRDIWAVLRSRRD